MSCVIGIDVSTTATKAIVVDESGTLLGVGTSTYDFETPRPLWVEQDPQLWWEATTQALDQVMAESAIDADDVAAIGLTGQMHGAVLLDDSNDVIRPAILWNDQRTQAECDQIRDLVGRDELIALTGNDALTGFTAPKLMWVANHEPENWKRVRHILLPKDYVRFRLTGNHATDVADGSGTILFDLAARTWSSTMLETLGIDPGLAPAAFEGPAITGTLSPDGARSTGLRAGTPVVAGGGDQTANAVGVGAVTADVMALSLGTSGVVFSPTEQPTVEPEGRVHSFCHAMPERWHMMGVMLSAAGSLRWLRDALAPDRSFESLTEGAAQVEAGSDGLLFLPYLTGERTPHPDPWARGAFVGLTVRHDLRHLTRAVLEGVAFGLKDGLELMVKAGIARPAQIRASGGGVKSRLWRQVLADVLDAEIVRVETEEGAAYGAAVLATVGADWFGDVPTACAELVAVTGGDGPRESSGVYQEQYERYAELYPALQPTFHSIEEG